MKKADWFLVYFFFTLAAYPIKNLSPFINDFFNITGILALVFFIVEKRKKQPKEQTKQ